MRAEIKTNQNQTNTKEGSGWLFLWSWTWICADVLICILPKAECPNSILKYPLLLMLGVLSSCTYFLSKYVSPHYITCIFHAISVLHCSLFMQSYFIFFHIYGIMSLRKTLRTCALKLKELGIIEKLMSNTVASPLCFLL